MKLICSNCNSNDVEGDELSGGGLVCTNCGVVQSYQTFVNHPEFEKSSWGNSTLIGVFVGANDPGVPKFLSKYFRVSGKEFNNHRDMTMNRVTKDIQYLCDLLHLNKHHLELATNIYKTLLDNNLTKGRKYEYVYPACAYIACRLAKANYLLAEFADVLQIKRRCLGKMFKKLVQLLEIQLPLIDPSSFILKFAHQLRFGSKINAITKTAEFICKNLKSKYFKEGRNPAGVFGAVLFIAARLHDLYPTFKDIVKVTKVNKKTLQKRVKEFGESPIGSMTVGDFEHLEKMENPDGDKELEEEEVYKNPYDDYLFGFKHLDGLDHDSDEKNIDDDDGEIDLTGIDDKEIDSYIRKVPLSEKLWLSLVNLSSEDSNDDEDMEQLELKKILQNKKKKTEGKKKKKKAKEKIKKIKLVLPKCLRLIHKYSIDEDSNDRSNATDDNSPMIINEISCSSSENESEVEVDSEEFKKGINFILNPFKNNVFFKNLDDEDEQMAIDDEIDELEMVVEAEELDQEFLIAEFDKENESEGNSLLKMIETMIFPVENGSEMVHDDKAEDGNPGDTEMIVDIGVAAAAEMNESDETEDKYPDDIEMDRVKIDEHEMNEDNKTVDDKIGGENLDEVSLDLMSIENEQENYDAGHCNDKGNYLEMNEDDVDEDDVDDDDDDDDEDYDDSSDEYGFDDDVKKLSIIKLCQKHLDEQNFI